MPTSRATVQAKLGTLRLTALMSQEGIRCASNRLGKLISENNLLTPQAPASFRDDEHKICCLPRAIIGVSWAQKAISQLSVVNYAFNQFLSTVRDGLRLHSKEST